MPFQIYCDLLEDNGVDTRLLRSKEPAGVLFTIHPDKSILNYGSYGEENACGADRDLGKGTDYDEWRTNGAGCGYGLLNGDGYF